MQEELSLYAVSCMKSKFPKIYRKNAVRLSIYFEKINYKNKEKYNCHCNSCRQQRV